MSDVTDYRKTWEDIYQRTYAEGKKHWRPELAAPPVFAQFMESDMAPPKGSRILEAGCGDGLNAISLARSGYVVTGVDISEAASTRAREVATKNDADVEFLCLDLVHHDLPEHDGYDLWVDIKTLHVLWEDADRQAYLHRMFESLKPGGLLFLNCAMALADVREHFPEVFAALDPESQKGADKLDRDLPREERSGIRCETLDFYCQELENVGLTIREAKREASIESGWGVIIVAEKCA